VGFLNTNYKFSLLVFEFTKTKNQEHYEKFTKKKTGTGFLPGHESESGDCPQETGYLVTPV
jgi:hypothetical protein